MKTQSKISARSEEYVPLATDIAALLGLEWDLVPADAQVTAKK